MKAYGFDASESTFHKGHMRNAVSIDYGEFLDADKELAAIRSEKECRKGKANYTGELCIIMLETYIFTR